MWDDLMAQSSDRAIGMVFLGLFGAAVLWGKAMTRRHSKRGGPGGILGARIYSLAASIVFVLSLLGGLTYAWGNGGVVRDAPTAETAP